MLAGLSAACTGGEDTPPPMVQDAGVAPTYTITSRNLVPAGGIAEDSVHRVTGALRTNSTETATSSGHRVNGRFGPLGR